MIQLLTTLTEVGARYNCKTIANCTEEQSLLSWYTSLVVSEVVAYSLCSLREASLPEAVVHVTFSVPSLIVMPEVSLSLVRGSSWALAAIFRPSHTTQPHLLLVPTRPLGRPSIHNSLQRFGFIDINIHPSQGSPRRQKGLLSLRRFFPVTRRRVIVLAVVTANLEQSRYFHRAFADNICPPGLSHPRCRRHLILDLKMS